MQFILYFEVENKDIQTKIIVDTMQPKARATRVLKENICMEGRKSRTLHLGPSFYFIHKMGNFVIFLKKEFQHFIK